MAACACSTWCARCGFLGLLVFVGLPGCQGSLGSPACQPRAAHADPIPPNNPGSQGQSGHFGRPGGAILAGCRQCRSCIGWMVAQYCHWHRYWRVAPRRPRDMWRTHGTATISAAEVPQLATISRIGVAARLGRRKLFWGILFVWTGLLRRNTQG